MAEQTKIFLIGIAGHNYKNPLIETKQETMKRKGFTTDKQYQEYFTHFTYFIGTQAEYDALNVKQEEVYYITKEGSYGSFIPTPTDKHYNYLHEGKYSLYFLPKDITKITKAEYDKHQEAVEAQRKIDNWLRNGSGAVQVSNLIDDLMQAFLFETGKDHTTKIIIKANGDNHLVQDVNAFMDAAVQNGIEQEIVNSAVRAQVEIGLINKDRTNDYTKNVYLEASVKEWMTKHAQGTLLSAYLPVIKELLKKAGLHSILDYYKRASDTSSMQHLKAQFAKLILGIY